MEGYKNREDADSKAYQKFRHRPHTNPLADLPIILPCSEPSEFPFAQYFVSKSGSMDHFDYVDIGCGYGDFIEKESVEFADSLFLGLEIRDKAVAIGQEAILDARNDGKEPNTAIIRCNVSRQLPFLLGKSSVRAFTVMFPDPHFKLSNERRRVLTRSFAVELHYYLVEKGYLLVCTDVGELHEAMCTSVTESGLFDDITDSIDRQDHFCAKFKVHLIGSADAQRHLRKDDDKTIYVRIWERK